jgi:hypothetical protein
LEIGRALQAYEPRVDIWTCNVGSGSSAPFLDDLREVWRVRVRGLTEKLASRHADGRPVEFFLMHGQDRVRGASWFDQIPPDRWWRDGQLPERPITLPDSLLSPRKSAKPSGVERQPHIAGGRASTYRNPPPLGPAPRSPR